jgi:pimeloyl-ACP methyl ester carboxylesterase
MPYANLTEIRLHYVDVGVGPPIVFIHEFAGEARSWDHQVQHFARSWRCVVPSARGYPPSDVPVGDAAYSQDLMTADVVSVLDAAGIEKAHVVGLSMGGYTALMLASRFSDRVLSCTAAATGGGATKSSRTRFIAQCNAQAEIFDLKGKVDAREIGLGPTRVQLANKDPIGWETFVDLLSDHPGHAAASIQRAIVAGRPSLFDLESELRAIEVPVLLIVGDEDEATLDVNLWMKRIMTAARLVVLPGTGHVVNLEEPSLFNSLVERFIVEVALVTWQPRDPRAISNAP